MNELVERERRRAYAQSMDRIQRGIWIGIGLLAMLGGTLVVEGKVALVEA